MSFLSSRNGLSVGVAAAPSLSSTPLLYRLDPSLLLSFAGAETLDPRITFSRTSNATVTNSAGVLTYAPHNLLTYSEQFDASAWTKSNATIAANATTAPNGTVTADKLIDDSVLAQHSVRQNGLTIPSGSQVAVSFYAKAAERTTCQIYVADNSTTGNRFTANFDLENGTTSSATAVGTFTVSGSTIVSVGNGWYRCEVTGVAVGVSSIQTRFVVGTLNYTGDGTSGIYIWGAQLNVGALQPYYTTTVKNLLGYTQEFDNAAWTKSNSTVTANATTAPDGSLTADKLVASAGSAQHYIGQGSLTTTVGQVYTLSYYAKAGEYNFIQLTGASSQFGSAQWANFDLVNGVVGNKGTTQTNETIVSMGNGWYRCSITITATVATTTTSAYLLASSTDSASRFPTFTGDGTSGVYIWGAQLSDSASLDAYVYNPGAAPSAAAYYGPRFDYDPVTLAPKGLLIEEQRTNLLTYSSEFDNAAWSKVEATITANSTVAPDGTATADAFVESTATTAHFTTQSASVVLGTIYTFSTYAKNNGRVMQLAFGTGNFGSNAFANFDLSSGSVGSVGSSATATIQSVGNGWYRCAISATATTTGSAALVIYGATTSTATRAPSYTGNGTSGLYIWGAQLEAGAFATSYIPTTSAQVTRAADVATMTGANFSNWWNATEGTLFAQFSSAPSGGSAQRRILYASDGTANNRVDLRVSTDGVSPGMNVVVGGASQAAITPVVSATKFAGAYKVNDFSAAANGVLGTPDTSGTVPTVSQMNIGGGLGSEYLNGPLRRIAYYNRRLSNAELQGITS
jgi:hypothetical protein